MPKNKTRLTMKIVKSNYFVSSGILSYAAGCFLITILHIVSFSPHHLPSEYNGPGASVYNYLVNHEQNRIWSIYVILTAIHAFESTVAVIIAMNKGVKEMSVLLMWFFQTMVAGFLSLRLILAYKPKKRIKSSKE